MSGSNIEYAMREITPREITPARKTAINAILFDKDGTLIDFNQTWFEIASELAKRAAGGDEVKAKTLLDAGGYDWETARFRANSVIAAGTVEDMVTLWHPLAQAEERRLLIADYDAYGVSEGAKAAVGVAGLETALQALKDAGYILGIATNDSEAGARATAEALGISGLFTVFIGYDTAARAKPHADPLLHFAAVVGVTPAEVAMVGDNLHDLECARAAQAGLAIGVLTGNSSEEVLSELADTVLPSIADLPRFFRNIL